MTSTVNATRDDERRLLEGLVRIIGWDPAKIELDEDRFAGAHTWYLQGTDGPFLMHSASELDDPTKPWQGFGVKYHAGSFLEPPSQDEFPITEAMTDFASCAAQLIREVVEEGISIVLQDNAMYDAEYFAGVEEALP